jgi:hypothetical protein
MNLKKKQNSFSNIPTKEYPIKVNKSISIQWLKTTSVTAE